VLVKGRYSGEGILAQLPRGEEAIVTYGTDYDIEIYGAVKTGESQRTRVKIESGLALVTNEVSETTTYEIRNKGSEDKHLIVEHPRRSGRRLETGDEVRTTRDFYRFALDLAAGQSRDLPVREILFWDQGVHIESLDETSLAHYFSGPEVPGHIRSQLSDVVRRKMEITSFEKRQEQQQQLIEEMFQDQERVRLNLQALGRSEEEKSLRDLYVRQFGTQESQLSALRSEVKALDQRLQGARREVEEAILAIVWE